VWVRHRVYILEEKCNVGLYGGFQESTFAAGRKRSVRRLPNPHYLDSSPDHRSRPFMVSADATAAGEIATGAGRVLLSVRETGGDPKALKAFGDSAAQAYISEQLANRYPFDAILSEEADDDSNRLVNRRVWIIDPLDGTREFSEPPRVDWAVHVALVEAGELVAGAVALPGESVTFSTNDQLPGLGPVPSRPRILVSRTRPTEHALMLAETLGGELVPMGSAGAKVMAVVRGNADVYVHSGGQWEWDSAAPVAIALAAGLHVSRLAGSAVRYNQPNPWLPDILICRSELAQSVIQLCRAAA
jgi:3'(2'), 5'-bisphosphate nucleotidase